MPEEASKPNPDHELPPATVDFILVRRKPARIPWVNFVPIKLTSELDSKLRRVSLESGQTQEEVASYILEATESATPKRLQFNEAQAEPKAIGDCPGSVRSLLVRISRKMYRKLRVLASASGLRQAEVAQLILETAEAPVGHLADLRARLAEQRSIDLITSIASRIPLDPKPIQ